VKPLAIRHPGELRWETRLLAVVVLTLVVFGIVGVYGASSLVPLHGGRVVEYKYALVQLSGAVIGGILLIVFSRLDYDIWRRMAWPLLLVTICLLVVTVLPGTEAIAPTRNGARRWLQLGPLSVQPSEVARLVVVIWCAMLVTKKGDQLRKFRNGILPFVVILGAVFLLILLEPNLSMATLIALLGGIVVFAAGARVGHFMLLLVGGVLLAYDRIQAAPYRIARLQTYLHGGGASDAGFQIQQSIVGFGSGQFFGVGLGHGSQKMGYLPYAYSDFLFSHIGEEWGFLGVIVVVSLYATFCWLGFRIARTAQDAFGQFLAIGLTATVGVTAFMHMAVNLGMMPTTGLTLPFMSYGRTSQVIALASVGILLNIGRQRGRARVRRHPEPERRAEG
jgi:cell division protein FtsW